MALTVISIFKSKFLKSLIIETFFFLQIDKIFFSEIEFVKKIYFGENFFICRISNL